MKAAYSTKNLSEVKHKQGAAPVGPTRLLLLTQLLAAVISFSTCCTTPVDAVGRVKISVSLTSLTGDLLTFDDEDSTSFEADPLLMTVDELQEKVFHAHMRHIEQKEKAVGPPTDEERYLTSYGFDGYKKMLSLVWYDPRGNPAARHDGTLDLGVVNVKVGPALLRTMRPYQTTVASSATLASAEGLQLLNYRLPHGGMAGLPNDQHEWVREVLSMESAPERVKYAVGHCWKAAVNAALMEKEESEAGEHKPRPLMLSPAAMAAALTREKELKKMLAEKLQPVFSVETFEARERFEDEDRPF
eukprot:g15345.t1